MKPRRKNGCREWGLWDRRRHWRITLVTCMALLIGTMAAAAGVDVDAQEAEQALVRFVHVSPDAPPFDIYVDDQLVVKGVEFPTATDFLPFPGGEHHIQIVPAGSTVDGALVDIDQTLDQETAYEIVAIGLLNDVEGEVFEVDTSVMDGSHLARLRLIHAAPYLGSVDVEIEGGEVLFDDVDFPSDTDYRDITADTLNLMLRNTDSPAVLARMDELEVEPGWVYDIFIAGQLENDSLQFLAVKAPAASACANILNVGEPDDGCVRFLHASPDTPPLAIYLDDADEPYHRGLAYGAATAFTALPDGEHRIRVVAEGGQVEEPALEATFVVESREAFELVVSDVMESMEIRPVRVNLGPLPVGQARVRVTHVLPEVDPIDIVMSDGAVIFEEIGFGEEVPYAAIPSGPVSFEVVVSGEDHVLIPSSRLTLDPGMVYNIFVTGSVERDSVEFLTVDAPSISAREREGIQPARGDGAPPVASPEIVPTVTPTPDSS